MFTGIVEEIGRIIKVERGISSIKLAIQGKKVMERMNIGDSISVNGICLTVTSYDSRGFYADVMPETLRRTNLRDIKPGSYVNLERALTLDSFVGGHLVSGHIDGVGTIDVISREDNALWLTINAGEEIIQYVIEKGSVALDGTSLTVAEVGRGFFKVSLIPHSADVTVLGMKKRGDLVNIECDMIGKYVKKFADQVLANSSQEVLTREFLAKHGF
jgi:riboflavin synthase